MNVEAVDSELSTIVTDEERVLARVQKHLAARELRPMRASGVDYDAELIALRDAIAEARLEDVPPLVEQMERLQQVAARRAEVTQGVVDLSSPYFGRLVLEEGDRKREVLIGRATYLDPRTGIRIVDWRDAPVSRLYYRYHEGDDYDENFGGRDVEGEILVRRNLSIMEGKLRRIGSPQGTFVRDPQGHWYRASSAATQLRGGSGTAARPEQYHAPRRLPTGPQAPRGPRLGIGGDDQRRVDKHLPEIAALIDPVQFDLITRPDSGLVVIQGGAGSGKTTIGLHRMAYLAYQNPRRFRPDKMLVVVFNKALARYVSQVLPALGVSSVAVTTYDDWASKLRRTHIPGLTTNYSEETPSAVVRFKKHPAVLRILDEFAARLENRFDEELARDLSSTESAASALAIFRKQTGRPLAQRLLDLQAWANSQANLSPATRQVVDRITRRRKDLEVSTLWSEFLTDRNLIADGFARHAPGAFTDAEFSSIHLWCSRQCTEATAALEEVEFEPKANPTRKSSAPKRVDEPNEAHFGIDGAPEETPVTIDREDDAILLRLVQRIHGPLYRNKEPLAYEHLFVDEAQDLSPVELAVVIDTVGSGKSITLAGDVAQRLLLDNGFTDWRTVLSDLGLSHVNVEPLRVSYRSTRDIMEFANYVLGPLAPSEPFVAARDGLSVEFFRFAHSGDAVAFLGGALRELVAEEPRASVAVITRYPEQADLYFQGLKNAEVPHLRRIVEQDFPFKPGVDVTDVRQVKGLEFDYVVLVEVSQSSYPSDDEARHLLHIAGTRAAHQLWVTAVGEPSALLPDDMRDRGF